MKKNIYLITLFLSFLITSLYLVPLFAETGEDGEIIDIVLREKEEEKEKVEEEVFSEEKEEHEEKREEREKSEEKVEVGALWAMNGSGKSLSGEDDSEKTGAQFLPSGVYKKDKSISLCGAVISENNTAEGGFYTDIYYPENEEGGCGEKKESCKMFSLSQKDSREVFCNNIKENNFGLPTFNRGFDFSDFCKDNGLFSQEKALVYCCDASLSYSDTAGDYIFQILKEDKSSLESFFTYLPLAAYEIDFSSLDYGEVTEGVKKTTESRVEEVIKNTGNTPLDIVISQDDMGLGKTDGEWNVEYGVKIGKNSSWIFYSPFERILLRSALGLAEEKSIDFAVEVLRFPEEKKSEHKGKMSISVKERESSDCKE